MNNNVRRLREARGLTQKELSQQVGVSRQAINAIETGKYDPSIRLLSGLDDFSLFINFLSLVVKPCLL